MTGTTKATGLLSPEDSQGTGESTVTDQPTDENTAGETQTENEGQAAEENETTEEEQNDGESTNAEETPDEQTGETPRTEEGALPGSDSGSEALREETAKEDAPIGIDGSSLRVPLWGAALLAALALAAFATALAQGARLRKLKNRFAAQNTSKDKPDGEAAFSISVGKLHEQGARKGQQDCFAVSDAAMMKTHGLLAVVADGMGGLADGDKVSTTAVEAALDRFMFLGADAQPKEVLLTLAGEAVRAVNDLLGPDGFRKSGSTLVLGLIRNNCFSFLGIGDSRVCLYRDGTLTQLNREHIYENELALQAVNGERSVASALSDPKGGGLVSFLGMGRLTMVDLPAFPLELRAGDRVILMSDGVYNALAPYELTPMLAQAPEEAASSIREAVREKNYSDQDNYTAVILGCEPRREQEAPNA